MLAMEVTLEYSELSRFLKDKFPDFEDVRIGKNGLIIQVNSAALVKDEYKGVEFYRDNGNSYMITNNNGYKLNIQ